MTRSELEHILRASAAITGASELVVIGSQAILGQYPDAPAPLVISMDADVFSFRSPNDAELIEGSIGEHSPFHTTFGYYAHGVGEETAMLPAGWKDRLVRVHGPGTGGATGLCLEIHDLAVSKLVAGRPNDVEYIDVLLHHRLADRRTIVQRLAATVMDEDRRCAAAARLGRISG